MRQKYKRSLPTLAFFAITILNLTSFAQEDTVRPRLTPAATPSPTPVAIKVATLSELQTRIRQRIFDPGVRRGRVGIKIVSLKTDKVVFENDSEKYFVPASNMKSFTIAAALERLGPEFRFITSVYANALPDTSGTIKGDLRIFGRGDVSISTAFFGTSSNDPDTYYKGIDRLVDKIVATGVKRIEGGIIGDESYFKGFPIPLTWEWDDLQWYYGAEISALPLNDNAVDLSVKPGQVGGAACVVTISPPMTQYQIINTCITSAGPRSLAVYKRLDRNIVEISGTLPVGDDGFNKPITLTRPAELFVAMLKQRLVQKGVIVTGGVSAGRAGTSEPARIELTRLESPPLREIAATTMKVSNNLYTETILWTLGEVSRNISYTAKVGDSGQLGIAEVKRFLSDARIPFSDVVQHDGSGLSRHNLVTPSAVATLYTYMAKQSRYAQAWRDSLTIGGVDGTLARRFKGTMALGNIRGKTGTVDQVSALSGYVTTAGGEELVVSIIVNGVPAVGDRTSLIDDIVVSLANFNGRID